MSGGDPYDRVWEKSVDCRGRAPSSRHRRETIETQRLLGAIIPQPLLWQVCWRALAFKLLKYCLLLYQQASLPTGSGRCPLQQRSWFITPKFTTQLSVEICCRSSKAGQVPLQEHVYEPHSSIFLITLSALLCAFVAHHVRLPRSSI